MGKDTSKNAVAFTGFGDDDEESTVEQTVAKESTETSSDDVAKDAAKEPAISFELGDQKAPEPKKVKIKTNRHVTTSIGGIWYDFNKGKEISVPPHVRDILKNAGYLEAL